MPEHKQHEKPKQTFFLNIGLKPFHRLRRDDLCYKTIPELKTLRMLKGARPNTLAYSSCLSQIPIFIYYSNAVVNLIEECKRGLVFVVCDFAGLATGDHR